MQTENITVIIKPTNACNLRCSYCYNDYDNFSTHKMSVSMFQDFLDLLSQEYKNIRFIWHGGEPLLMGREFYERCFAIQKKYITERNISIQNSIQTNATLIDSNWCDFIKKYGIRLGISFDGPPFGLSGRNGTDKALKAISILKSEKIRFGSIAVINKSNYMYLDQIYDYFSRENISVSLNGVFEAGKAEKHSEDMIINSDEYFERYKDVFFRWVSDNTKIRVDPFAQILETILYGPKSCVYSGCLYRYISVDHEGNVFPCGRFNKSYMDFGKFYSYKRLSDFFMCDEYNDLAIKAIARRRKCKNECELYQYCNGGCNADAMYNGDIASNGYLQCENYKKLVSFLMGFCDTIDGKEVLNSFLDTGRLKPRIKNFTE